jgi:hypothetical protein
MCNGFKAMGIFMESLFYYRDCESFFLFCFFICIHARQFYASLDPDCYRNYILPRCLDCASTYSSTSASIPVKLSRRYPEYYGAT